MHFTWVTCRLCEFYLTGLVIKHQLRADRRLRENVNIGNKFLKMGECEWTRKLGLLGKNKGVLVVVVINVK